MLNLIFLSRIKFLQPRLQSLWLQVIAATPRHQFPYIHMETLLCFSGLGLSLGSGDIRTSNCLIRIDSQVQQTQHTQNHFYTFSSSSCSSPPPTTTASLSRVAPYTLILYSFFHHIAAQAKKLSNHPESHPLLQPHAHFISILVCFNLQSIHSSVFMTSAHYSCLLSFLSFQL